MQFGQYAPYLNLLYNDKLSIYRNIETTNVDGTSHTEPSSKPLYTGIPCLITFKTFDAPDTGSVVFNNVEIIAALYCKNSVDIKKGDYLKVTRFDSGVQYAEFEGLASEPNVNPLCKKTFLIRKKSANPL